MERDELLSKLDLIEEHAKHTLEEFPQHLTKERQQMIIALVKQVRWLVAEDILSRTDPEATVRMHNDKYRVMKRTAILIASSRWPAAPRTSRSATWATAKPAP